MSRHIFEAPLYHQNTYINWTYPIIRSRNGRRGYLRVIKTSQSNPAGFNGNESTREAQKISCIRTIARGNYRTVSSAHCWKSPMKANEKPQDIAPLRSQFVCITCSFEYKVAACLRTSSTLYPAIATMSS